MNTPFFVEVGPHPPMLCIQAYNLTQFQLDYVRGVLRNNYMPSEDYKLKMACNAFLQGQQDPREGQENGWVLVEFWNDDMKAINEFVNWINEGLNLHTK